MLEDESSRLPAALSYDNLGKNLAAKLIFLGRGCDCCCCCCCCCSRVVVVAALPAVADALPEAASP